MHTVQCDISRKHIFNLYGHDRIGIKRPGSKEKIIDVKWEKEHLKKGYKPVCIKGRQVCRIFSEGEYAFSLNCSACNLCRCCLYIKLLNDRFEIVYKICC